LLIRRGSMLPGKIADAPEVANSRLSRGYGLAVSKREAVNLVRQGLSEASVLPAGEISTSAAGRDRTAAERRSKG
jgi:hypothetical protein